MAPSRIVQALSGGEFAPEVRRVLRVDVSATLLTTTFVCLTEPFTGLILRRDLQATPLQLSVMASGGAACLLLSLAWARLMDGRPPLACAVWPGLAARALFLLMPFVHTAWPFIGILVAGQLFGAVASPAQASLIQRVYPRAQRGRALGLVKMAGAVPAVGLTAVAGALLALVEYRWLFPIAGLLGIAASLRLRRLPVPDPSRDVPERTGIAAAWGVVREDSRFRRLLLAHFLFGAGVWMQVPANPLVVADIVQATTTQIGLVTAVGTVAGIVASGYWGRWVDRAGSVHALRAVYVVGATMPLFFYVARSPWMLLGTSLSEAVMASGLELVWVAVVIDAAGPGRVAQYVAISATLVGVRGVLAPLVSALVIQTLGVHAVYLLAAGLMLGAAWLVGRTRRAPALGLGYSPAAAR